jgi:hypothetical protein
MEKSAEQTMPPGEFIKAVRARLRNGEQKQAYRILLHASGLYPDHPLIVSYLGWLQSVIDKKFISGIASCRKAFVLFKSVNPETMKAVYPVLYLNLGRAFLLAGKKKEAVENFIKGLGHDRVNIELKKEMQLLGIRKAPLVPFLPRTNPINKYVGMLLRPAAAGSRPQPTRGM